MCSHSCVTLTKKRAGDTALLPCSLIFCSILITSCGLGITVTLNGSAMIFSSFTCNLAWKKRMQLNFISSRNVLHQLQIKAWPWFANFHRFRGCSASSQCNSWDMAKEQLFIECILFQLPNVQIQGTFSLRRHWYIYLEQHYTDIDQEPWQENQYLQVLVLSHGFGVWL